MWAFFRLCISHKLSAERSFILFFPTPYVLHNPENDTDEKGIGRRGKKKKKKEVQCETPCIQVFTLGRNLPPLTPFHTCSRWPCGVFLRLDLQGLWALPSPAFCPPHIWWKTMWARDLLSTPSLHLICPSVMDIQWCHTHLSYVILSVHFNLVKLTM